jgi:hypothetical protein
MYMIYSAKIIKNSRVMEALRPDLVYGSFALAEGC